MKLGFHGAAQTVTGSRHLLEVNGHRLLLDCGLYQGRRDDMEQLNRNFPFEPDSIDAVLLSHAHIDHCGNLPNLVANGYEGPIHATYATSHLTELLIEDSAHIQEDDAAYENKKRAQRGEPPVEPLYTSADAARAARQLVGQDYDTGFEPVPGVQVRFVEAGHILGSAAIMLDIEEAGRSRRLVFSGDIGREGLPLLRDPVRPTEADFLIMECTYGDRSHDAPDQAYKALRSALDRVFSRGGKVIVPAFAMGRTQTLVYFVHQMIDKGEIPGVPVFVDSPLAINITGIFRQHPECFDAETRQFIQDDPHGAALGFDRLKYTLSVEESKAINRVDGPALIISASGMAHVGRILHHLKNNIEDPKNCVLITSWMAPHTLGRRLVEGDEQVRIFGESYDVAADVVKINGMSAHAGQDALLEYALASRGALEHIFLVHGEQGSADALTAKLNDSGFDSVSYPAWDETVEL
ncbi:MAG: MBL fold metallo-hydrolase [Anaerolineales bacterium]|nr:MBL fold metallo-hydrolase [Anaerolineales bacterium]